MNEDQPAENVQALDYFGKLLITHVRDLAIRYADQLVAGNIASVEGHRLSDLLATLDMSQRDAVNRLIPLIVDETLYLLLNRVDADRNIEISVRVGEKVVPSLRETSDDLNLELPGWRDEYSKERSHTLDNLRWK